MREELNPITADIWRTLTPAEQLLVIYLGATTFTNDEIDARNAQVIAGNSLLKGRSLQDLQNRGVLTPHGASSVSLDEAREVLAQEGQTLSYERLVELGYAELTGAPHATRIDVSDVTRRFVREEQTKHLGM